MSTTEIIYLIPGEDIEGYPGMVWCESSAPSDHCDPEEAVKYVRADTVERLQARVAELEAEEEGAKEAFGVIAEHNEALRKEVKRLEGGIKSWQQGYYSKEGSDNAG